MSERKPGRSMNKAQTQSHPALDRDELPGRSRSRSVLSMNPPARTPLPEGEPATVAQKVAPLLGGAGVGSGVLLGPWDGLHELVAQICNLPYRRIVFCGPPTNPTRWNGSMPCRLQIGDTAECNSALRFGGQSVAHPMTGAVKRAIFSFGEFSRRSGTGNSKP